MNPRHRRCLLIATLAMLLAGALAGCRRQATEPPPAWNVILLISIDTLNPAYLGCYGDPIVHCPTLDRLARRGCLFSDCHTAIHLTTPSHISLLTSVPPMAHGVYRNARPAPDHLDTLAEVFSRGGFATAAAVGVFQLDPEHSNLGQGFDEFFPSGRSSIDAKLVTDQILEWSTRLAGRRAFAWLHYFDCHAPYRPRKPYRRLYDRRPFSPPQLASEVPRPGRLVAAPSAPLLESKPFLQRAPYKTWYANWLKGVTRIATVEQLYRGTISEVDRQIERLLRTFSRSVGAENLLVAVTSDHGESFGQHGMYFDHQSPYEPNLDVPLLLHGPGLPEDRVYAAMVGTVDLAPTLVELAGLEPPDSFRGRSVVPILNGERAEIRETLVSESSRQYALSIRDREQNKLIVPIQQIPYYPQSRTLFQLELDPGEQHDRLEEDAQRGEALWQDLTAWVEDILESTAESTPVPTPIPEVKERLESLGYISP